MPGKMFNPNEVTVSKMRPYSIGIVAQNKDLNSNFIQVMPQEDLNMANGEITGDVKEIKTSGSDSHGAAFNTTVKAKSTLTAEWIPMGCSNRLTSPDVRRGAVVMIYQFGDSSDHYFWCTLMQDLNIRKLETVIYAWSATTKEADKLDGKNSYFLEISTHKKLVTFHTSKANGESFGYDIQINTGEGRVTITDDVGNTLLLDSAASRLLIKNSNNSKVEINKTNISIEASDSVSIKCKAYEVNAPDILLNGAVTGTGGGGATFEGPVNADSVKADTMTSGHYGIG